MAFLYLYAQPFATSTNSKQLELIENEWNYTTDEEKKEISKIYSFILAWGMQQKLITENNESILINAPVFERSWQWRTLYGNWRFLSSRDWYDTTMSYLGADNGLSISLLITLHAELGMLFDTSLLNKLCNRVMQSISAIAIPIDENDTRLDWTVVHQTAPYLWILILLQGLIKFEAIDLLK